MTPYLITAPAAMPVTTTDMKAHLRVDHSDDDGKIADYQSGAVAILDAWGGVLGRCIMSQTWAVDVIGPGPHVLPFPDATSIAATSGGVAVDVEVSRTGLGQCVTAADAAADEAITIEAVYGLPAERLPAAQTLVKLMVSRDYDAPHGPAYDSITRSIDALIGALRWGRVG